MKPDLKREAELVYSTTDITHPTVNYMFNISNDVY